jgi:hypothetical protein
LGYNLSFIILEKRTKPEHLAIAIELNCCSCLLFSIFSPFVVKSPYPVPCIVITVLCIVSIITAHSIGPVSKKRDLSLSKNFENTVYSIIYQYGSVNETLDEDDYIKQKWT